MERNWLFTWRTYGTWLPGEPGFVGFYVTADGYHTTDNTYNRPTAAPMPALTDYARNARRASAVYLTAGQAEVVRAQLLETAAYRDRPLDAVAVMTDHVHIVFGVADDPDPGEMLADWKAYASRALNRLAPTPNRRDATRPRWWAEHGSTRVLKTVEARVAALRYVRDQERPLVVWLSDEARRLLGEPGA